MSRYHINMSSARWQRLRLRVFERDGYRCQAPGCGKPGILQCDHIQPIAHGGDKWDESNLQAICRSCHLAKTRIERGVKEQSAAVLAWREFVESGL